MTAITKSQQTKTTFLSFMEGDITDDVNPLLLNQFSKFRELLEGQDLFAKSDINYYREMKRRFAYEHDASSCHVKIDEGYFMQVLQGTDREDGTKVVIKKTLKRHNNKYVLSDSLNEIKAYQHLCSVADLPIPRYLGYCFCSNAFSIKLIIEKIPGKDLFDSMIDNEIRSLNEIIEISRQLLEVLVVFEREGYHHCDIKPENLIWYKGKLIFIDLGHIKKIDPVTKTFVTAPNQHIQTFSYCSPENVLQSELDSSLDLWSVGCVIYSILTNRLLFPSCETQYDDEVQLISEIYHLLGLPPCEMLEKGAETNKYFQQNHLTKEWNSKRLCTKLAYDTIEKIVKFNLRPCFRDRGEDVNKLIQLMELFVSYKRPRPAEALKEFYERFQKPDVMI
jgi:serine/threonine protein kinase